MRISNLAALPAALLLGSLSTTAALAHAGISPNSGANGTTVKLAISIPHGCDGAATDTVILRLPEGFVSAKPMVKPGWGIEISKGDYARAYELHGSEVTSGALEIKWTGGSVPDDQYDEFVVRGTLQGFEQDAELPFAVTQLCGGASVSWDQVAAPGEDAHALPHPAPVFKVTAAAAQGHEHHGHATGTPDKVTLGALELSGGFTRATLPNAPVGGGFLSITNTGSEADILVSATSPLAGEVQLHEMTMEGEVMKMQQLAGGIPVPAGETVTLAPGGLHLMFMQLKAPFVEGESVPVTLTFEKAGTVELMLSVGSPAAKEAGMDHSHHGG